MKHSALAVILALTSATGAAGVSYIWATDTCVTDACRQRQQMEFAAVSEAKWERARSDFQSLLDFQLSVIADMHGKSKIKHDDLDFRYSMEISRLYSQYSMGRMSEYMPPIWHRTVRMSNNNRELFRNIEGKYSELSDLIKSNQLEIDSLDIRTQPKSHETAKSAVDRVDQKFSELIQLFRRSEYLDKSYIDQKITIRSNFQNKARRSFDDYAAHVSRQSI